MHLVSYLGYLLGCHGKECSYVIISKDMDYDNIVKFWVEEGYTNLSRREKLSKNCPVQKEVVTTTVQLQKSNTQTMNNNISDGRPHNFDGKDRCELNNFIQKALTSIGYQANSANIICKLVIAHCNDERMLSGIHNDLKINFNDYSKIYKDVKPIIKKFVEGKSKVNNREVEVRSFFEQNFKKKIYVDCKEKIIDIILKANTKQQVNNGLLKLYADGNVVKDIYKTIKPLINELPSK